MFTYKEEKVAGDGNCCFRSLGKGFDLTHQQMRHKICYFIFKHPQYKINGLSMKNWIESEKNIKFTKYLKNMSTNGTWGGGFEIAVASHIFKSPIILVQRDNITKYNVITEFLIPKSKQMPRFIIYSGLNGLCHYDYLRVEKTV
jgi:hypothetical protein